MAAVAMMVMGLRLLQQLRQRSHRRVHRRGRARAGQQRAVRILPAQLVRRRRPSGRRIAAAAVHTADGRSAAHVRLPATGAER